MCHSAHRCSIAPASAHVVRMHFDPSLYTRIGNGLIPDLRITIAIYLPMYFFTGMHPWVWRWDALLSECIIPIDREWARKVATDFDVLLSRKLCAAASIARSETLDMH